MDRQRTEPRESRVVCGVSSDEREGSLLKKDDINVGMGERWKRQGMDGSSARMED